jgi:Zn-dependent protease with chaperone function
MCGLLFLFGQTWHMAAGKDRRRLDGPSVGAFLPIVGLAPIWLVAVAVFWLPLKLLLHLPYWAAVLIHLGLGLTLLYRPIQQKFLMRLLSARAPTAHERRHLEPLWQGVLANTRMARRHFVLAVTDSDDLNAFASGGHLVIVTTGAFQTLPGTELQGVIAHEIGHQQGWVSTVLVLGYWLALPVMALARVGFFLDNVATAATRAFADTAVVKALGGAAAVILRALAWVFQVGIVVWQSIGGIVSRQAEFRADEWAVNAGFGVELAAAMRRTALDEPTASGRSWGERVFGSHPPLRTRIAKVEALTRRSAANRR